MSLSASYAGQRNPEPMVWVLFVIILVVFSLSMRAIV